ncbi:hypothetical protein AB0469_22050 [Streptomyces sp. NPDC093801]
MNEEYSLDASSIEIAYPTGVVTPNDADRGGRDFSLAHWNEDGVDDRDW